MKGLVGFYGTTLGKKVVVALTGAAMVLFVIGHMVGNLKMFAGFDPTLGDYKMDEYARYLRSIGAELMGKETFLWIARLGLIAAVVLHVVTVIQLKLRNRKARPDSYVKEKSGVATLSARFMMVGGLILLGFIVFHILHFTTGTLHFSGFEYGEVYENVYAAFTQPAIVILYLIAMLALAFHLYHGVWSMFQTLGLDNPDRNSALRWGAKLVAVVTSLGFSAVPLGIFLGLVAKPMG